ncbi:transcriptional regulator [Bacillus coahuilensis m2-6]|uniref:Transcriptional regulator n=1 Tax=Bacillus coahuilensis p1.1.43 TaxID=1150625 RepID=A0A147K6H5_9BACI|nr:forespore capture DNA-binding protein RefZ [Bacillus coahuilensis]KUP05501.1 transcriptional regulator [Bacillus coahuilensis p1.1.43]KUP06688.1 transcriptional regulator [Bacillus coahuilensis m2-6]
MKKELPMKERLMDAAITLFHTKGYDGTSVRDISKLANVNPANISYYFKNKQGLLEKCLTQFFEGYIAILEQHYSRLDTESAHIVLQSAMKELLEFQREHYLLARFVWREVSVDSQIVREIFSSYLMKERYILTACLKTGMDQHVFSSVQVSYAVIQLKSMLTMPFINQQYVSEVWNVYPQESFFIDQYYKTLETWVNRLLHVQENMVKLASIG